MLLLVWLLTVVVAAIPAAWLGSSVRAQLSDSVEAAAAADGVNYDWMQEFRNSGSTIARALRADVIGFAAVLDNISALADQSPRNQVAVAAGAVFVLTMWFLGPGIIERLATNTPIDTARFLSRCGSAWGPVLRLGLVAAFAYGTLLLSFHPWLFDRVFDQLIHDTTAERVAFFLRFALYAVFFLLVGAFNLLFDVARTRLVLERRRSALGALVAGAVFLIDHFKAVAGQYILNVALFAVIVALYAVVAPGVGRADWTMWVGFGVSQLYICGRILVRLSFLSGTISALETACGRPRPWRTQDRELP